MLLIFSISITISKPKNYFKISANSTNVLNNSRLKKSPIARCCNRSQKGYGRFIPSTFFAGKLNVSGNMKM